jgi:hypothetical protein
MTTKSTKKKVTKKRAKVGTPKGFQQARFNGPPEYARLAAQACQDVSLPDALKAFDAALEKVQDIRSVLVATPDDGRPVNDEVLANRARRLGDAASNLQVAGWTLRESAYREADK